MVLFVCERECKIHGFWLELSICCWEISDCAQYHNIEVVGLSHVIVTNEKMVKNSAIIINI